MEKILYSSDLYSHPGRVLEDHLIGVGKFSQLFLREKPVSIQNQLKDINHIIALCHDLGKATSFFQDYLLSDKDPNNKPNPKTKHSLLSAIPAYFICKEISENVKYSFFAFLAVRRHHGNLIDISDEVTLYNEEDSRYLISLVESINNRKFSILAKKLFDAGLPVLLTLEQLKVWIDEFIKETKYIKKLLRQASKGINDYLNLNLLYSILLDADKSDAVIKDITYVNQRFNLSSDLVDIFKSKIVFKESSINNYREKAYKEIIQKKINPDQKLYSLNLPTGLGKTLASLSFSLRLRNILGSNHRIIYALPFLSIIDQNHQIFESVLTENGIVPNSNILLKHHHLSELYYKIDPNSELESNEAKILIEGWNAEIIVTTFMQLFHSMISNQNKSLRKFHKLANSIIILDEIQAIPIKYWSLLRNIFLELAERFNTYIIFVTATEPLIFNQGELTPLVLKEKYFNQINRITIKPFVDRNITLEELINFINIEDQKSYLFILNTISSARHFFNLIEERGLNSAYLSTHIIPKERLKRIQEIRDQKHKIVISTQLVEAGVDIDFDVVVRDLAPFDSINQAAGRCNRNSNRKGIVYVFSLRDNNNRLYSSYIYDPVLIDITRKLLINCTEIKENNILTFIQQYYQEVSNKKSHDVSLAIIDAIRQLNYDSYGEKDKLSVSDFKLIEEDFQKIDVFIEIDDEAEEIWKKYLDLKNINDLFERKKRFDSIKASFYQYVISIPKSVTNKPAIIGDLGYVAKDRLHDFYDYQTGYILKDDRNMVVF